jgi:hypothetical protein
MVPLGEEAQVGPFKDSANFMQDRCTVGIERTIGSEIVLDAPDVTSRWRGSCGMLVQDRCTVYDKHTIGS